MKVSTFIERPVLSAVISITIMVAGIIGLFTLPVEQYPDIASPTVMVSTTYFGANAETMQKSVVAPLEEAINGVEDMTYMTSTATNSGTATITIYFQQGTDPDMAAVNVQNRVSKATGQLPAEVTQVGVTTSVSVDHATPAAFYAHQADRNMNYEIAVDLTKANFDFYAGGGFLKPDKTYDKKDAPNIFPIFEEAGYTVARGYSDYKAKSKDAGKMILIQEEGKDPSCLPYAIDRKSDDLTLAQITESAIDFLTKGKNKGFFLMVEGGKIDWACHGNDAATVFNEVKDMDDAIKVAYEFYKKHPKETLIVVTADHETGGIVLGTGKYALNLKALQYQKHSADGLSRRISELRKSKGNKVTWEDMKEFLGEEMGFWKQFPISWEQEKKLRDEFEQSFVRNKVVFAESMYSKSEPMAARAKEVMDQISMVGWVSGGHSAGYVPVFAIGAGSQLFGEKIDNTEIPKRIAKAAGYK